MQRAKARNDDFERHIISQIDAALENKKTILKRISHIKLLTQSKGEKHWILTTPEGQVGWVPSENRYVDCFTNKPPSNSDLAKLLELCPFTQTLNMALTIRNYIEHSYIVTHPLTVLRHPDNDPVPGMIPNPGMTLEASLQLDLQI